MFSSETGRGLPEDEGWGRGSRPVIHVSWDDAKAYAEWLSKKTGESYRLPSEAEWEYAARAGSTTKYHWGNDIGRNKANCSGRSRKPGSRCGSQWDALSTAPVGSFQPNRFGLFDMHGNVVEWVEDCYQPSTKPQTLESYQGAPTNGSAWTSGSCDYRVLRGGSWLNRPGDLRSADRNWDRPHNRDTGLGFRLAQDL